MNKKQLSERDICTKLITPALVQAGWDVKTQVREEFPLTKGRIIVRGKLHTRAKHATLQSTCSHSRLTKEPKTHQGRSHKGRWSLCMEIS
jgi:hypothetical protein